MAEKVLLGREQQIFEVPQAMWEQHLADVPEQMQARLSFMTDRHQQVRHYAVRELVKGGMPIEPESISERLEIPLEQVKAILEELESKLFFLVRNRQGAVAWAYPVTVEPTPHRLVFSTGERLYGA
ncbi:MAG TPA: hypothetical protein VLA49_01510 [Anaerolineales bacterium]|nr:hypothetical protein [Anaerolineales bacterium]